MNNFIGIILLIGLSCYIVVNSVKIIKVIRSRSRDKREHKTQKNEGEEETEND